MLVRKAMAAFYLIIGSLAAFAGEASLPALYGYLGIVGGLGLICLGFYTLIKGRNNI